MKNLSGFLTTAILGAAIGYVVNEKLQKAKVAQETKLKEDSIIKPKVDPEYLNYDSAAERVQL